MIADYWPYIVIIIGGWLATDLWRYLGVIAGNRLDEESEALRWVRAVATALVMAVTAKLIVFPAECWRVRRYGSDLVPRLSAFLLSSPPAKGWPSAWSCPWPCSSRVFWP